MILWLQNPDCKENPSQLVRSATITWLSGLDCYSMNVSTKYTNKSDLYKTVVSAKRDFGKKFFKGAKWGEDHPYSSP